MENVVKTKKERKSFKETFLKYKNKITSFFDKALSTNKRAILLMSAILVTVMTIYFLIIFFVRDNFYQNWSDDSLQYYPFMIDFVDSIKSGTFSLFNFKNYLGASFFSDTYYVPLDGFTLIIFLLSFIIRTEIAMSIVEILKLIGGSIALSCFLSIRGYKPRTVFLVGLFYFSSSGITCFSCFPSFTSLAFYLPFSLIFGHYFIKGKWLFVPLYAFVVVFYNFYLAYTVFAFMSFSMIVLLFLEREKFFKSLLKLVEYVALILFGLMMSLVIFLPSMEFVLQSTSRNVAESGSLKGLFILFRGYIEAFLSLLSCTFRMLLNVFKTPTGLIKNRTFFYDSYLPLRQLYHTLSIRRNVDGNIILPSFFDVEEYYRVMSTTFIPLTPSSFVGFQGSYFIEHISLYITGAGLILTSYIWFMNDYKSRVFKVTMVLCMIMMVLPFFSYILSASLDVLYTRWFNVVSIPMLVIVAYVLDNVGLYDLKPSKIGIILLVLLYFGIFGSYHYQDRINGFGNSNNWNEDLMSFENKMFYIVVIALFIIIVFFISMYIIEKRMNKKVPRRIMYGVASLIFLGVLLFVGLNLLKSYNQIPKEMWSTEIKESILFHVEDMMSYEYLTFITLLMIVVAAYAICSKKKIIFRIVVCLEFALSAGLSFGSNIVLKGRNTTFKNSHNLGEFLKENTDERDIYRIYVDSSIPNFLSHNIARFTHVGTNQNVFHSFIYAGTDEVANIIYDKSNEGQANKKALNNYSYYLNVLLGYKYVVANPTSSFSTYDENQFELVTKNDDYILLKFKDYTPFLEYDGYSSRNAFTNIKNDLSDVSRVKLMLNTTIVEKEDLETLKKYFSTEKDISTYKDTSKETTFYQRITMNTNNYSSVYLDSSTDGVEKTGYYYRYAFSGDDEITTRSYAINVFGYTNEKESLVENKEIFLKYNNGEIKYLNQSNISAKNGSTFHIPVYGVSDKLLRKPEAIYVFYSENEEKISVPSFRYTAEAILPPSKYIDSYEKGEKLPSDAGLLAAMKFSVDRSISDDVYDSGVVRVKLTKYSSSSNVAFTTMYFEYEDGTIVQTSTETSINKKIKNIYVVKSSEVYSLTNPPQIKITKYDLDGTYNDQLSDKNVDVKGSKVIVSYKNNQVEEGNSIIVVPIPYSEEWTLKSGSVYETFSANGGFLGLIVPKNIESNSITLKFEPTGLKLGLNVSLVSILLYTQALMSYVLYKKKRRMNLWKL